MAKHPFKISARAASLIGKENIATAEGAIIELVKNSYDADALDCVVLFDNKNPKKATLTIIDNGDGMTEAVIMDHWMKIGTSNKLYDPYSKNRRIKSGAKGIGRFALDRLGDKVEMYTISKEKREILQWRANWSDFADTKTLDQVYADLDTLSAFDLKKWLTKYNSKTKRLSQLIKKLKINNGTVFRIENLRDVWDEDSLDSLYRNLEALVPPKEISDFKLTMVSTKLDKKYGEVENRNLDDYDYKLKVNYNSISSISVTLDRREFNWKNIDSDVFKEKEPMNMSKAPYDLHTLKKSEFSYKTNLKDLWPAGLQTFDKKVIESIGSFEFTLYFLRRTAKDDDIQVFAARNFESTKRKTWLDNFGGIKLFRDDFRVRPYGEIGSNTWDWLNLGDRATSSTFGPGQAGGGWRVNPNQVYGLINISRINNPELKDTTNREGLVSNKTFDAFQELVRQFIKILELDRHYIIRPMRVVADRKSEVITSINLAKSQANEDLLRPSFQNEDWKSSKTAVYAKAVRGLEQEINDKDSEIRMLRSLASIGMTIATFTHELSEIRHDLVSYSKKLLNLIHLEIPKERFEGNDTLFKNPFLLLSTIIELTLQLSNWIDFSNNSVKRNRRKATDIDLGKYFVEFEARWHEMLKARAVKLTIDDSLKNVILKKSYPVDLDSIFNNLLLNSIDAFYRKDSSPHRKIRISAARQTKDSVGIIYEDSGPGLLKEIKDPVKIFEPFFSTKKHEGDEIGIGLGMWVVKTTIEQYKGYAEILRPRPNFKIRIQFSERIQ